jgi:hypothetical protein
LRRADSRKPWRQRRRWCNGHSKPDERHDRHENSYTASIGYYCLLPLFNLLFLLEGRVLEIGLFFCIHSRYRAEFSKSRETAFPMVRIFFFCALLPLCVGQGIPFSFLLASFFRACFLCPAGGPVCDLFQIVPCTYKKFVSAKLEAASFLGYLTCILTQVSPLREPNVHFRGRLPGGLMLNCACFSQPSLSVTGVV